VPPDTCSTEIVTGALTAGGGERLRGGQRQDPDAATAVRPPPERCGETVEVLIVDDQPEFRAVLRDLVNLTPGMTVVGEACTGEAALEAAADLAPRLVIMDIRMPGMGGVEATRRLVERRAGIVVFLVSVDRQGEDLRPCGAAAFLSKQTLSSRALRQAWDLA
jgi:DNA-binding NarL/FixJ family response regulator